MFLLSLVDLHGLSLSAFIITFNVTLFCWTSALVINWIVLKQQIQFHNVNSSLVFIGVMVVCVRVCVCRGGGASKVCFLFLLFFCLWIDMKTYESICDDQC